jgi:hypothetical protein
LRLKLFGSLFLLTVGSVFAAPITGDLFITGSVRIDSNSADFFPLGGISGNFNAEPSSTGFFATVVDPTDSDDGNIADLSAPVGVDISVNPFLTFDLAPNVVFELTRIANGAFPPCLTFPNCSVNQFNLTQSGNAVIANFNVSGNVLQNGVVVSTFVGSLGQTFTNTTIAAILNQVQTAGFIDSAFDGNFTATTAIPEPGTTTMLALGGLLTAFSGYLRRKRS